MEKILLEINAGEGGADSASFVKDMTQVYL
jgi:protein subunit release factor A